MRIIIEREVIRTVRDRFMTQYKGYPSTYLLGFGAGRFAVGESRRRLAALDLETCSRAEVDVAVGTDGWASLTCDECGEAVERIVRIGQEPDYEARWQDLCLPCLEKACALMKAEGPDEVEEQGRNERSE